MFFASDPTARTRLRDRFPVLTATTEGTAAITGLSDRTAYDLYFVAEDDETAVSNNTAEVTVPENTAVVIDDDGWFHTGDVVRQQSDGTLCFVDRRKNVIRRSGENISALEVEAALSEPAAVAAGPA